MPHRVSRRSLVKTALNLIKLMFLLLAALAQLKQMMNHPTLHHCPTHPCTTHPCQLTASFILSGPSDPRKYQVDNYYFVSK